MRVYLAPKRAGIVDEFGIWPYDRDCGHRLIHWSCWSGPWSWAT